MIKISRSRCAPRALLAILFTTVLTVAARADLLFLKDGFVIQGQIKRDSKLLVEKGEGVDIPVGPFYLEDGPRRIMFSPIQIRIVEKRDAANEERYLDTRVSASFGKPAPDVLSVLDIGPFDAKWQRTLQVRTRTGSLNFTQHLGYLSSYWGRLDGTKAVGGYSGYLTREFTPEQLVNLLMTHPKLEILPGMSEREIVARRRRIFQFLVQVGYFEAAEQTLQSITADFPGQADALKIETLLLNKLRGRERYEQLKRMHVAGQAQGVTRSLNNFATSDLDAELAAEVRDLKDFYATSASKVAAARQTLHDVAAQLRETDSRRLFRDAAKTIAAELQPESLTRLDAFLSQARQHARQKNAGKTPDLNADELMSLAVTGWLLGGPLAETKPVTAVRLWRSREMMVSYLQTSDADKRTALLAAFMRDCPDQRIDEILQIIPTLPPHDPESKIDTVNPIEMTAPGGYSYLLQLPPEYRHNRSYPVLVALPDANEKPQSMLRHWRDAAGERGYIIVVPSWQETGTNGYGYTEKEHAAVFASLTDLRRRYNVDSDRVFLFGLGQGGNMAFDVGLSHPDQFAGVSTMGGVPNLFAEKYFRNAQYLPFYCVNGTTPFEMSRKMRSYCQEWNTRGYPALFIEYAGRGIEWFGGEVPNIMDWMQAKRRAFPLRELGKDGFGGKFGHEFTTSRSTDNQFYWLSIGSIHPRNLNAVPPGWRNRVTPAMVCARIDTSTNVISIVPRGVSDITILLSRNSRGESLIDFNKPVKVQVELKTTVYRVKPSLEMLMEDLYQRGDRQRPYLAKIEVK